MPEFPKLQFEYFTKLIPYKGYGIETYVIGSGEKTVLSFPSFPHSGLYYLWFLNHYNLDRVRFITFDLPGWIGYSENLFKETKQVDIEDYISIAKEIIKTYNLKEFSLLGYSYGAALAIRLAHECQDEVKNVVLVSSVFDSKIIQKTKEIRFLKLIKRLKMYELLKLLVYHRWKLLKYVLLKEGLPANYLNLYYSMMLQVDPRVITESLDALFSIDWSNYLESLENKRLLIVNSRTESKMFRKQAELLRRRFPEGKSLYLSGHHDDFVLRPKSEVVRQVVNFLRV